MASGSFYQLYGANKNANSVATPAKTQATYQQPNTTLFQSSSGSANTLPTLPMSITGTSAENALGGNAGDWQNADHAAKALSMFLYNTNSPYYNQFLQQYGNSQTPYNNMQSVLNGDTSSAPSWYTGANSENLSQLPQTGFDISKLLPQTQTDLSGQLQTLGNLDTSQYGNVPQDLSGQVQSAGQYNANGAPASYTVGQNAQNALTNTPAYQDIENQVKQAYGTINNASLQDMLAQRQSALTSNALKRGITDSSIADTGNVALQNWKDLQGAQMNAQGTLAALQAGQGIRQENAQNALSLEGLNQAASTQGLDRYQLQEALKNQYLNTNNNALAQQAGMQADVFNMDRTKFNDLAGLEASRAAQNNATTAQQWGMGQDIYNQGLQNAQAQATQANTNYGQAFNQAQYEDTRNQALRQEQMQNFYNMLNANSANQSTNYSMFNPLNIINSLQGIQQPQKTDNGSSGLFAGLGSLLGSYGAKIFG